MIQTPCMQCLTCLRASNFAFTGSHVPQEHIPGKNVLNKLHLDMPAGSKKHRGLEDGVSLFDLLTKKPLVALGQPAPLLSWQERQAKLTYNVDEEDAWLRTVDFTPASAFGRSFAYRCAPKQTCFLPLHVHLISALSVVMSAFSVALSLHVPACACCGVRSVQLPNVALWQACCDTLASTEEASCRTKQSCPCLNRLVLDCSMADLLPGGAQADLLQTLRECRILSYSGNAPP